MIELARGMNPNRFQLSVATFYDGGALREEMAAIPGIRLYSLGKSGRWDLLTFLDRLDRLVKRDRPQVIYSILQVANLFGLWAGQRNHARVVWGMRNSLIDFSQYDWTAGATYRLAARFSGFADRVIYNSWAAAAYHPQHGFSGSNGTVIPNGIDTQKYRPDELARQQVRTEWGIGPDEVVIGMVGRLDPVKDHPNFLRAAQIASLKFNHLRFVCAGGGDTRYLQTLCDLAVELGIQSKVIWPGTRPDMPRVYNGLDLFCSSSYSESFPNVLGEAMASQLPCVVTDTGDSARILGDIGIIVPTRDPQALADGLSRMLALPTAECTRLGQRARSRIEMEFSVAAMVQRTEDLLENVVNGKMIQLR